MACNSPASSAANDACKCCVVGIADPAWCTAEFRLCANVPGRRSGTPGAKAWDNAPAWGSRLLPPTEGSDTVLAPTEWNGSKLDAPCSNSNVLREAQMHQQHNRMENGNGVYSVLAASLADGRSVKLTCRPPDVFTVTAWGPLLGPSYSDDDTRSLDGLCLSGCRGVLFVTELKLPSCSKDNFA